MLCPRCGEDTEVNRTIDLDFLIERNRRCMSCGRYFNTIEVTKYEYELLSQHLPGHQRTLWP